uniref:Uncharacterized protein n=1 Tax=Neogobius melanostomus TaxID=47308 RepID=A0A8C6TM25_9GOBI
MVSSGRQMLGLVLAIVGFFGSIIICALPTWRVTAFIGANICKVYDSLLNSISLFVCKNTGTMLKQTKCENCKTLRVVVSKLFL